MKPPTIGLKDWWKAKEPYVSLLGEKVEEVRKPIAARDDLKIGSTDNKKELQFYFMITSILL